jgi:hypothetical protein
MSTLVAERNHSTEPGLNSEDASRDASLARTHAPLHPVGVGLAGAQKAPLLARRSAREALRGELARVVEGPPASSAACEARTSQGRAASGSFARSRWWGDERGVALPSRDEVVRREAVRQR